jgi:hypothetical protein
MLRLISAFSISIGLIIGLPSFLLGSSVTELQLESQPGDPIGLGLNYDFTPSDGSFILETPAPYVISFLFLGNEPGVFSDVEFAAPNNAPLIGGTTYTDAERYPFQASDQPGLNVDLDGRGLNTLAGSFTVLEAVYNSSGIIENLGITFVQTQTPTPAPPENGSLTGHFIIILTRLWLPLQSQLRQI